MILMTRTIEICKPKKNKTYGYTLIFNYKDSNRNLIQARSKCGRSRGIKGEVFISGQIDWPKELKLEEDKIKKLSDKISFALDLAYSPTRLEPLEMVGEKIKVKAKITNYNSDIINV